MAKYLVSYAEHFGLMPHARLSTNIHRAEFSDKTKKWEVEISPVAGGSRVIERFDKVIYAMGPDQVPNIPKVPGIAKFSGNITHSIGFKEPGTILQSAEANRQRQPGHITSVYPIEEVLDDTTVEFSDGTKVEVDAIIWCTGYTIDYSMLGKANPTIYHETGGIPVANGRKMPRLYQNVISLEHPESLAFMGNLSFMNPAFLMFDIASMALAQVWKGRSPLPSKEEMRRSVDEQHKWIASLANNGPVTPGLVSGVDWLEWVDQAAGLGLQANLGYGMKGWYFWLTDHELCNMVMDGLLLPFHYRLFDAGKRKPWKEARESIIKDRTIIATAVPRIANQFHALNDIGWYAGAYLITSAATQLLWGRIYTFYNTKLVFIIAVVIFEVGSALCGGAPNSNAFIVGRAIAGSGSAGIFSGATVIITQIIPLAKRPILPIGGFTLAILAFFLRVPKVTNSDPLSRQLIRLDPLGTLVFLPGIICFLLALQWGGNDYPWQSGRIIALFVVAGVLIIAFAIIQVWRQEDATIPPRIIRQRSVFFGAIFALCIGGGMISMLYTLALWFQATKGTSAVQAGIDTIPVVLSLVVGSILSGVMISRLGYYVPFMYLSNVLTSVGSGLITTFTSSTGHSQWIGYQVLYGLGLGVGMQQPSMAAQTVLQWKDVSIGVSIMFFMQSLGGSIFNCISQALFTNYIRAHLAAIPGLDAEKVLATGAAELSKVIPADRLPQVVEIYNEGLRRAFIVVLAVSCLTILPALGMEWRSVKQKREQAKQEHQSDTKDDA
uniref:MFS general substrate transporter n=1 Tax=Aspergillus sp. FM242 TaxID=2741095 RepID=A0A6M8PUW2_9EURO|nr:MFS general substrate transporter [Aspergillus sp. FM242]